MQNSIREIIDKALYFHRQNKTAEAEELYSQALTIDENHPTALHLLGVICHQQNRNWESEKLILRALAISPDDLLMRSNLGAMPRLKRPPICQKYIATSQLRYGIWASVL